MCTVKELIKYLKTQNPEAEVEVLRSNNNSSSFVSLDLKSGVYSTDSTINGRYPNGYIELGEE